MDKLAMLSEVSQRKTNTIYHLHVESKKNKISEYEKKRRYPENTLVATRCGGQYRWGVAGTNYWT